MSSQKNMYNIIFLDIDGVLNNHYTFVENHRCQMEKACVKLFIKALEQIENVKVVLSSTWRIPGDFEAFLRYMHDYKEIEFFEGVVKYFHEDYCTDKLSGEIRGKEVKLWLDNHVDQVNKYICIDDDSDFLKDQPLLLTNRNIGFGWSEYEFLKLYFGAYANEKDKSIAISHVMGDVKYTKRLVIKRKKLIETYLNI